MANASLPDIDLLTRGARVHSPRVFEEICDRIRSQLASRQLKPGDKLPAERELAVQFGASRAAVREAIRSLEMAGLVELRKGVKGGAFIREGDPAVVTQSLRDMVFLGRLSLESLTESRVILQDAVIRLAAQRATEDDLRALDESIDLTEQLTAAGRFEERRVQLVAFYRLLAMATGNEIMAILVDAVTDIVLGVLIRFDAVPRFDTVKVQRRIVELIRQRRPDEAAALMAEHLKSLHEYLFEAQARHAAQTAARARPARSASSRAATRRSAAGGKAAG
ncbi:FadR/GntR family transcriptional regulator [Pigmentiphaga soli]|uniref:FadR/GntR family transcriptional regulator n=1 Tax=Pigmentiphaga soli TaxID=1007095 RepID=A0ABP8GGU1_9BURK